MKQPFFFLFLCFFMHPLQANVFFECQLSDDKNIFWKSSSVFEKKALNTVLDHCKKESINPDSCLKKNIICQEFSNSINTRPLWECTALDANAREWLGKADTAIDDAIFHAKAKCKSKSTVPETCYVYAVGCLNKQGNVP